MLARPGPGILQANQGTDEVSPVSGWRRAFGDWSVVGAATVVCHALGAVTSLLFRMLLDPAQMGIWQALKLVVSYGNYANLGISKGAAREFNVALGRGDTRSARHGLNLAFTVNTLTSLVYAAALLAAAVWIGWAGRGTWSASWAIGLVVVAGIAVINRYVTFHVTILRTKQAFRTTSRLSILEAVLTLVICGLATWRFGLVGLYAGTAIVVCVTLLFVLRHRAVVFRWAWDLAEIRRLVVIGGPILLAGTVSSLFRSLDKLMVLGYMNDREFQLGCYSLALMVAAQLYGLGNMLAMVMAPRYAEKFGQSRDRRQVARLAARSTEIMAALLVLPAAVAIVAASPILGRLLPKYDLGLAPLVWLVPGVVALALALPASQYLIAVDRQRRALLVVVFATAMAALGNHFALTRGYGLAGVAAATAVGYSVYFVLTVAVSLWPQMVSAERLRYVAALTLVLIPTLLVALWLERLWPGIETDWATTLAKIMAVLATWMLTVGAGWRYGRWQGALMNTQSESRRTTNEHE
jgi:O-antigen/teichoic acid export membrane protein